MYDLIFNSHTGAICGLVIGVLLGSVVLDHGWLDHYLPAMAASPPAHHQPGHAAVAALNSPPPSAHR